MIGLRAPQTLVPYRVRRHGGAWWSAMPLSSSGSCSASHCGHYLLVRDTHDPGWTRTTTAPALPRLQGSSWQIDAHQPRHILAVLLGSILPWISAPGASLLVALL